MFIKLDCNCARISFVDFERAKQVLSNDQSTQALVPATKFIIYMYYQKTHYGVNFIAVLNKCLCYLYSYLSNYSTSNYPILRMTNICFGNGYVPEYKYIINKTFF